MTDSVFTSHEHIFTDRDGKLYHRFFIVLCHPDGSFQFTNFHKYCRSSRSSLRDYTSSNETRVKFIVPLLNYVFRYEDIHSLDELSVDMVKRFLTSYGLCELPWDDEMTTRSKATVDRAIGYIMDFLILLMEDRGSKCALKKRQLYRSIDIRDKHGKTIKNGKRVPVFEVLYKEGNHRPILRDMPNAAFDILFSHVMRYHPELLGVIMLCSFAGLRASEACMVRREDSPLGPGILFTKIDGRVVDINIDLRHELQLRSDLVSVGWVKKHRIQQMAPCFHDVFLRSYELYTEWLAKQSYEADFGPFSVNTRGMAMTYECFAQLFHKMVKEELAPVFQSSEDPDVALFGYMLADRNLPPHCFRHWFTVQLVLSGVSDPGTLQHFRGDSNPASAIEYLNNKGELEKMYRKLNEETFDYLYWLAGRRHD